METIHGFEAIARMRQLKNNQVAHFQMAHLTADTSRRTTNGLRHVDKCRLREAMPDDAFGNVPADLFLTYVDLTAPKNKQNRMCRKKLIRYVAFPPDFTMLKVEWFNTNNNDI